MSNGSGIPHGNYVTAEDIANWPSGTTADEMQAIIEKQEDLVEQICRTHFYPKAFDIELNGNDRNRLFLPLKADIITVSAVYLWGEEIDSTWYTWDAHSIYIDLREAVPFSAEMSYKLATLRTRAIFPYGYNNVRILGVYGLSVVPSWVKQVVVILVQDHNDPHMYTHYNLQAETMGRYSYTLGAGTTWKESNPTGVWEADRLLRYHKRRKCIIMSP